MHTPVLISLTYPTYVAPNNEQLLEDLRMEKSLAGKVALITGASSGIGAATAERLAAEGAMVVVTARRLDRLEALVERIRAQGGEAEARQADAAVRSEVEKLVKDTHASHGRLDILINNAGGMLLAPAAEADPDDWQRMLDLNLMGLMQACHTALPLMKEQGGGHIVNISSLAGRVAMPGGGAYSVTKFGVNAFSEALRKEHCKDRIRITVVEPGPVATELPEHITHAASKERIKEIFSGVEQLQGQDVAEAIAYAVTQPARVNVNEILLTPTEYVR